MKNLFIRVLFTVCSLRIHSGKPDQTEISKQTEGGQKPKQTVVVAPQAKPAPTGCAKRRRMIAWLVQITKADNPLPAHQSICSRRDTVPDFPISESIL
jgi:hypothetical protein